jgi:hypothetical protein
VNAFERSKMLTEYLERALEFARLAGSETKEIFKAEPVKQAGRTFGDTLSHSLWE